MLLLPAHERMGQHTYQCVREQNTVPTYLSSLDINIGKGVLPPVLLKQLFLLPLNGLGVIILVNPLLRPEKVSLFQKMPLTLHSKFLISLTGQYNWKTWQTH